MSENLGLIKNDLIKDSFSNCQFCNTLWLKIMSNQKKYLLCKYSEIRWGKGGTTCANMMQMASATIYACSPSPNFLQMHCHQTEFGRDNFAIPERGRDEWNPPPSWVELAWPLAGLAYGACQARSVRTTNSGRGPHCRVSAFGASKKLDGDGGRKEGRHFQRFPHSRVWNLQTRGISCPLRN